jgi:glucose-6-phosphate dehydrogenase assembly protein OpcA
MTDADDRLSVFRSGAAIEVKVAQIEDELAALWRSAAEEEVKRRPNHPLTRACLWNLIVRVADEFAFESAKALVDEIAAHLPVRAIVIQPDTTTPAGQEGSLRAWVEVNWHDDESRGLTGSDEVTLQAAGKAKERLPALVRSLLQPDASTALLWLGEFQPNDVMNQLIKEVDRVIVDSRKFRHEEGLVELHKLTAARAELDVADLAWLGISPLRGLTASLFDPPADPSELDRLSEVDVIAGVAGNQTRGLLMLGWLGSTLGWYSYRHESSPKDRRSWRAVRRDGEELKLRLSTRLGGPQHGVVELALAADVGRAWRLRRDQHNIDVTGPSIVPRCQPVRSHRDADLIAAALGARGRDPVFRSALEHAARLIAAQE